MYYLDCVETCLEGSVPDIYCNYQNCFAMSDEDKINIVALCAILSPEELLEKVIFDVDPYDPSLKGTANRMYEVEEANTFLTQYGTSRYTAITVEGREVTVCNIMMCCEDWLIRNFDDPMRAEAWRLQYATQRTSSTKYYVTYQNYNNAQTYQPGPLPYAGNNYQEAQSPNYNQPPQQQLRFRALSPNDPQWMPDNLAAWCMDCNVPFKMFKRRHHCRRCGKIFCADCCPKNDKFSDMRWCRKCRTELIQLQQQQF
jgi:hypothetical protein